jgi:DNA helicase-2/ATP-dependent DNA helicase PcrA
VPPEPARRPALAGGLSPEQARAVAAPGGPLLVLAGPGSGKTLVLTLRLAHRLAQQGLAPEQVLAIAFTNRSARELADRLAVLLGAPAARVAVATFHAACHRFLVRPHAARLGRSPAFSIYDTHDARALLASAVATAPALHVDPVEAQAAISRAKAELAAPQTLAERAGGRALVAAWRRYALALQRADAVDFDDLVGGAVRLLAGHADIREQARRRFRLVLVDEFQDTNRAQLRFLQLLAGPAPELTAVADEDQAVYAFRGADVSGVLGFERLFPGARVLRLERNFRSTPQVVAAAGRLIAHNRERRPKRMVSRQPPGPPVTVERFADATEEARAAAAWCRARVDAGAPPREVAVLHRTRGQARPLEEALLLAHVPYRLLGGQGFFEHAEIRDALAYLALLANPRDRIAFARALQSPRRGLGPAAVARLIAHADAHDRHLLQVLARAEDVDGLRPAQVRTARELGIALGSLAVAVPRRRLGGLVAETLVASGVPRALHASVDPRAPARLERLRDLVRAARAFEATGEPGGLVAFLARAALLAGEADEDPERVTLATIHAAKGLEWRHVRVVGLEDGLLPHRRALAAGELEEERRLAYVAMTRARTELVLSWAASRHARPARPSRFLAEAGLLATA